MRMIIFALLVVTGLSLSTAAMGAPDPEDVIAFAHVSIVAGDGGSVTADQTVVIKGDRILSVGDADSAEILDEATIIDGRGKFLMPGLAEMHGHIPPTSGNRQAVEDTLFLYLARGVTTVRGMLGSPGQLRLKDEIAAGTLLAPTLYLAGPSFSGRSISSAEQARKQVRGQVAAGWDLLKVHGGLARGEYDAVAETATRLGISFGGHVSEDVGLLRSLEAGQETIDHMDGYMTYLGDGTEPISEAAMTEIAQKTKTAGAWVVPTHALWKSLAGQPEAAELEAFPEIAYVSPSTRGSWQRRFAGSKRNYNSDETGNRTYLANRDRMLSILNREGVRVMMGSDAPQLYSVPGFSIIREAQAMVEAGMPPADVIRAGAIYPGQYFVDQDKFGDVQPGMRADLILLDDNPLEDIGNLGRQTGVMVRGRWLDAAEISARLQDIARRNAN